MKKLIIMLVALFAVAAYAEDAATTTAPTAEHTAPAKKEHKHDHNKKMKKEKAPKTEAAPATTAPAEGAAH